MALDLSGGVAEMRRGSQIVVCCGPPLGAVAGLELWRRAVYTACRAGFARLVIVSEGRANEIRRSLAGDHRVAGRRWEVAESRNGWVAAVAAAGGRWVWLSDRWIVDAAHLRDLAETTGGVVAATGAGPFAADAAQLVALSPDRAPPEQGVPLARRVDEPSLYFAVRSPADFRRAEDALFANLARDVTNFFARHVDRPMSRAISRVLAPYPVTPNQITIFSIGLGIVGALCLLRPTYGFGLLGSSLFLLSTIVDGCDGEIARLKFQESPAGARLDVIGDNVVHAALFPCVALHAYFRDPSGPYLWLGASALGGVVATWGAIWTTVVRRPPKRAVRAFFDAFGNRELAYLFLLLGVAGVLHWFVWAMALGLWLFPLGLIVLDRSAAD
jgi:phosphatidylglycerophosphate synthase